MGKKSRKNKKGNPTIPLGAAGGSANAAGEALTLLPPSGCCHGSKVADFKNLDYIRAVQACINMHHEITQNRQAGKDNYGIDCQLIAHRKFDDDHQHLTLYDTNFCDFIFSFCTHLYLNSIDSTEEIQQLLELALSMRYIEQPMRKGVDVGPGSEGETKYKKYTTDVCLQRGMINCLARETPCDCMKPKKLEAQKMDRTGICHGCLDEVPKNTLKLCTGCNMVKYCSRECQVNGWPEHREACKRMSQMDKNYQQG
mmetsp:Transcript_15832/g.17104  ORF Transcript_15832/g.17104 Transcript_15832/m.17104 type:complete len:255 (-) Transcript_15832:192-956(-)